MGRHLVYVAGAAGAGKTSLAVPLAAELGYSLVTKDMIKETLHDSLWVPVGIGDLITIDTSRRVDVAAVAAQVRGLQTGT